MYLKKNEERRLLAGHLWIYSNEVDTVKSPLKMCQAGEQVIVHTSRGKPIAMACVNPQSLICARVYSNLPGEMMSVELIERRIAAALALRETFYNEPYYRLIHGEGDWLPGVIVDRYGDYLVMQINTAGMQAVQDLLIEALVLQLKPAGIFLRNSGAFRALEGLPQEDCLAFGEVPDSTTIVENGVRYNIPLKTGQKTGWFYDHRDNRLALQGFSQGKRVLDAYSYLGGWGLNALKGGAEHVTAVDSSSAAVEGGECNAALNDFADKWTGIKGDVGAVLRNLRDGGEQFDVVVLDPPAFIQRAKDKRKGVEKYRSINALASGLLATGGVLVSCSCSHHLVDAELQRAVLHAGRNRGYGVQLIARGHQGRDHPVNAAIPETEYLKAVFARMLG
ncbi:hypothetical protein AB833_24785 [Chromatiales bacterium (ex Bugula neritina AB1)]|nr:hypothetical protein AB833_24785 [Chromatiales bacterium (ex Bugula neritina AB1)]